VEHDGIDHNWVTLFSTVDGDLIGTTVRGQDAMAVWQQLRDDADRTCQWPVLLGPPVVATDVIDEATQSWRDPPNRILAEVPAVDLTAILHCFDQELADGIDEVVGEWPDETPGEEADPGQDLLTGSLDPEVRLALLPTAASWEAPAWLNWGGWNACPSPASHVAVLHHWNRTHGAELVAVTRDQLELHVQRPPSTRAAALAVAHEHFAYCYEIVVELGTINDYAAMILDGSTWTFWWD
jgi:hypothetical protein